MEKKQLTTIQEAQLLVNKYLAVDEKINLFIAIKCATIAVNTIIKSKCLHMPEDRLFWRSVKKELNQIN